ncbi:unnamed protein product [Acanthosepion pharaonis]|uniref:Uncharacterized protein n=1 Tax=Acanthosepion pharaonis TaxID=158019 RepID=A0A812BK53_ACAPH|nr:unnamed protein product [Sepia pharaonis]
MLDCSVTVLRPLLNPLTRTHTFSLPLFLPLSLSLCLSPSIYLFLSLSLSPSRPFTTVFTTIHKLKFPPRHFQSKQANTPPHRSNVVHLARSLTQSLTHSLKAISNLLGKKTTATTLLNTSHPFFFLGNFLVLFFSHPSPFHYPTSLFNIIFVQYLYSSPLSMFYHHQRLHPLSNIPLLLLLLF